MVALEQRVRARGARPAFVLENAPIEDERALHSPRPRRAPRRPFPVSTPRAHAGRTALRADELPAAGPRLLQKGVENTRITAPPPSRVSVGVLVLVYTCIDLDHGHHKVDHLVARHNGAHRRPPSQRAWQEERRSRAALRPPRAKAAAPAGDSAARGWRPQPPAAPPTPTSPWAPLPATPLLPPTSARPSPTQQRRTAPMPRQPHRLPPHRTHESASRSGPSKATHGPTAAQGAAAATGATPPGYENCVFRARPGPADAFLTVRRCGGRAPRHVPPPLPSAPPLNLDGPPHQPGAPTRLLVRTESGDVLVDSPIQTATQYRREQGARSDNAPRAATHAHTCLAARAGCVQAGVGVGSPLARQTK